MSLIVYKKLHQKKLLVINFIILLFTIYQSEVVSFPNTIHKFSNKPNAYRESAITYSFDNSYYFSSKRLDNTYFIQNYHYTSTLKSNMRYLDSFNKEKNSNLTQNIGKSAKYIVSLIAAFFIIFNESWIPMYYILCGVVNSTLSKILKHIFKQPRPIKSVKKGYGLPSSHAQSIFYFATIVSISSFRYYTNSILSIFISAFIWIYSYLACSWRISSNLHTVFQTVVGFILGTINGLIVSYFEKDMKLFLEKYLKASSIDISVAIGIRLLISLSGFIVIYSRELKSVLKKK